MELMGVEVVGRGRPSLERCMKLHTRQLPTGSNETVGYDREKSHGPAVRAELVPTRGHRPMPTVPMSRSAGGVLAFDESRLRMHTH